MAKKVVMDKDEFKGEHGRLLKVLKSKDRKDDLAEYKKQKAEVKKVLRKKK